ACSLQWRPAPLPLRHAEYRNAYRPKASRSPSVDQFRFRSGRGRVTPTAVILAVVGEVQLHLAFFIQRNLYLAAIHQAAEQQFVGQGTADGVLNQPLHRTGTHGWIEALGR